jgi:hypothetical protein
MDHSGIELHDARLVSVTADYAARCVAIAIEYYVSPNASVRVSASIQFSGVSRFSELSDLDELQSHAAAGNIAYWVPASGSGTTYIHLVGGLISVTAKNLVFASDA